MLDGGGPPLNSTFANSARQQAALEAPGCIGHAAASRRERDHLALVYPSGRVYLNEL
jgi:hypothetical protein